MHMLFPFSIIDLVEPSVQDQSYTGMGLVNFLIALSKKEFNLVKQGLFSVFLYFIFTYENPLLQFVIQIYENKNKFCFNANSP